MQWLSAEVKAGHLSILRLQGISNTNFSPQDLVGAGRMPPSFSARVRNDFMLGLVHEAVHLQNPLAGDPARGPQVIS
jgi:hypothetical protein